MFSHCRGDCGKAAAMGKQEENNMFEIFQDEKIVTICMLAFLVLSVFTRILLGFFYQNMIRETDNMATTNNKELKQCKLKFANCYQLNNGVSNIPVFVDKFLNKLSLGHLSYETMYHLSGQLMLLSVVCSGIGVCRSIIAGRMLGEILPFYIVSLLGLYLYFSVSTVVDVKGKKRMLKVNLVDYLENHLSSRIDVTDSDMEMLYGRTSYGKAGRLRKGGKKTVELMPISGRLAIAENMTVMDGGEAVRETSREDKAVVSEEAVQMRKAAGAEESAEKSEIFTKAQEKELEELLKEFLTS